MFFSFKEEMLFALSYGTVMTRPGKDAPLEAMAGAGEIAFSIGPEEFS